VTVTGVYRTNTQTGGYVGVEFTKTQGLQLFTDGTHVDAVSIAGAGVSEQVLRDRVAALLPGDLRAKTGDQVRHDDRTAVSQALSFVNTFLLAFGVIALVVGTFIIYNTFTMIIAQRVRELALLRAVGAGRRQVRSSVLFEATIIGAVGGMLGVAGGVGLAFGLRAVLDAMGAGLPSGPLVISGRTVTVALLVGIVVTLVSAYAPARRASKTPPVEAMREELATAHRPLRGRSIMGMLVVAAGVVAAIAGASAQSVGTGSELIGVGLLVSGTGVLLLAPALSRYIVGGLGAVVGRPFGAIGRLARTNSVRNPRRTAATAFALTVGLMLVSGIAVLGASTKSSINGLIDNDVRADYILQGTGGIDIPLPAVSAAAKVPGVQSMTQLSELHTTVAGRDSEGTGVDGPLGAVVKVTYPRGRRPAHRHRHAGVADDRQEQALESRRSRAAGHPRRVVCDDDDHRRVRRQPIARPVAGVRRHVPHAHPVEPLRRLRGARTRRAGHIRHRTARRADTGDRPVLHGRRQEQG
jgi:putative ABC transport system permease protein